eukprot:19696-Eustigmatos_ZCMA.PRE.1
MPTTWTHQGSRCEVRSIYVDGSAHAGTYAGMALDARAPTETSQCQGSGRWTWRLKNNHVH